MFDLGWSELLLIVVVAVFVVGPKEIPEIMMGAGRMVRRLQYMKFALTRQFEDFMEQHDLNEIRHYAAMKDHDYLRINDVDEQGEAHEAREVDGAVTERADKEEHSAEVADKADDNIAEAPGEQMWPLGEEHALKASDRAKSEVDDSEEGTKK